LAKVLVLTPERSLARKVRETLLALWLEHRFSKDQLLEIYLNRVYLGAGTYGVDAAAHRYFGKSAAKLSLFESAVIAGLLKAPSRFSPANDRDKAVGRAAQVLDNMVDAGFISAADASAAEKQGVGLAVINRPGSPFKPFVYLAGLEAGLRPSDHFVDMPIRVGNWQPHNYTNRYQGDMTLAEGLAQSINTIAVQVAERAGIARVIAVANRLGITSDLAKDASLALGTNEVNLLELVSAYVPFANGGAGILAYGISEIRDTEGRTVYRRAGSGPGPVVAPELVEVMNQMLAGVIGHGTGKAAALPRPAA